ncbi:putative glutamine amidotransferase [Anaerobacterium chartisolvens]|uniref:Putative glutamine amidotransferase n=1 Tax=Anaerobacterium chartisolvens TaxID=1297424 RepID=A0A369AVW0_9FIRM|nr:gamma-glutamyl-gamma-aminobutyrate hydrolase family protein [Anaerobacterium chartisolvens]RCX13195.1 putative glutamine amidotransferase [Anaerobacterium chartisolvens]
MTKLKPLIGITAGYDCGKNMLYLKEGYFEAINNAGGVPLVIPPVQENDILDRLVENCDGILFSGGTDIDALYYKEDNYPFNGEISPYRDFSEVYMARMAVLLGKPVLGICRGIQLINAAMGGTLYQDIYCQIKDKPLLKHSQEAPKWYATHEVFIEKGSIVCKCMEGTTARVNSFHHQAVKDVAPGLEATSAASDGIIESIEGSGKGFIVGVQWHPELMWQKEGMFLNLFRELVRACGRVQVK